MSYAQTNYNAIQGIKGIYRINQIGCFVTSFANMLTDRFGKHVDPLQLNAVFRDRGIYIDVDDGVRDDLGWSSITAYDGQITVVATGGAGWPTSDNSIVKFVYKSPRTGSTTTHFCLVASAANHTIVDSWDGVTKSPGVYGTPVAWASYANVVPQAIAPAPAPKPLTADYDGNSVTILAGWGLSQAAEAAGYPNADKEPSWVVIAALNGSGDWKAFNAGLKVGQRIVVGKYTPPAPAPTPIPVTTPEVAVATPTIAPETPVAPAVVDPTPAEQAAAEVITTESWKDTYQTRRILYQAKESILIKDLMGLKEPTQLILNQQVRGEGTFRGPDGIVYARTKKSVDNDWWYGLPILSLKVIAMLDDTAKAPAKDLSEDQVDEEILKALDMADKANHVLRTNPVRAMLIAVSGSIQGWFERLRSKKTKKTK